MTDMITWLRAQLDEADEHYSSLVADWSPPEEWDSGDAVDDLHRWRRLRSLIKAHRAVLDLAERRAAERGEWFRPEDSPIAAQHVDDLYEVVAHLAYAYRHRPGYLPEWAPEGAGQ